MTGPEADLDRVSWAQYRDAPGREALLDELGSHDLLDEGLDATLLPAFEQQRAGPD